MCYLRRAPVIPALLAAIAALLLFTPVAATADSIYLRSGTVIRTDWVTVENGRVVFEQYGGRVSIPLDLVERVVADEFAGPSGSVPVTAVSPAAQAPASPELPRGQQPSSNRPDRAATRAERGARESARREREREIRAEMENLEAWRALLDRAHRAFFVAHMSTTDVKRKIRETADRLAELERAARAPDRELPADREDVAGDREFLRRAHRAFFASHRSTTEVKRWIRGIRH